VITDVCWGWCTHRPELVRCDAHWHRPKRADWRAKAYVRATAPCTSPKAEACRDHVSYPANRVDHDSVHTYDRRGAYMGAFPRDLAPPGRPCSGPLGGVL
jgi:hypothetical protein